jgi:ATP diphosphatase
VASIEDLLIIMRRLRGPDGCPWDREQSFATVAPYTLEEAYEVDDAIRRGDLDDLRDELGDLLFQVVFHAQMAEEAHAFNFAGVVEAICDKLTRRHPHVFGDVQFESQAELAEAWERAKARERAERSDARGEAPADLFAGIPVALPALARAAKMHKRVAGLAGKTSAEPVARREAAFTRAREQLTQWEQHAARSDEAEVALGDLLLELSRLAQRAGLDPERALRDATARFEASALES